MEMLVLNVKDTKERPNMDVVALGQTVLVAFHTRSVQIDKLQ